MPNHPSYAQSEASRENGARSGGAVTVEGRARIRAAALRHGLNGAFQLLPGESAERYERLLRRTAAVLLPGTAEVPAALEELVRGLWRQARLGALVARSSTVPSPAMLRRYRGAIRGSMRRALRSLRLLAVLDEAAAQRLIAQNDPELVLPTPEPGKLRYEPRKPLSSQHLDLFRPTPEPLPARAEQAPVRPTPEAGRPMNRHERRRAAKLAGKSAGAR